MARTLIFPGLNGSGEGHWQQYWAQDDATALIVQQRDWERPVLDEWAARAEAALVACGEAFIVAHSLGCLLAARLADRPVARRIKGALLVAPCDLERTERLHPGQIEFADMPARELPFSTLVVGSLDDHYMSFERLRHYASLWKSDLIHLGHAGHINVASGFGRWQDGYDLVKRLKTQSDRPALATLAAS
ncbi:alpha/beta hydrolase [Rhizobium sp. BK251]|uniref:RBBP9/YdeN family alpha/beta hydrolase n=1 Tax=Rhizobium sp. BK251 TaxID=2512125 RepID=UPI0010446C2B|nr:alpha/beta hydrolase [Rhizobium sp. BK251]TCL68363.1 hypothetical protein EV286_109291 [Rhizobium sp. BK251]